METVADKIELTLPFKAEYVSIARLTVSGIASRMGFDIETIEDIKVAVAEVCNKLVSMSSELTPRFRIVFQIQGNVLTIAFSCKDKSVRCIFGDGNDELGVSIINALMDSVEFCNDNGYLLSMSKAVEGNN